VCRPHGRIKIEATKGSRVDNGEFELKSRQLPSLEPMVGACVGGVARQMESVRSRSRWLSENAGAPVGGTARKGRARFEACIT
jgi:hypothetical protein